MKIIAIANIVNEDEKTIGFRLLDIDKGKVMDVPIESIQNVLENKATSIENLGIKEGLIVGTNGSTDRLAKAFNGILIGKSSLVILNQIEDKGYTVSDYKGIIKKLSTDKTIEYAKKNGIANGKIVSKDGKEHISSITGTYDIEVAKVKINVKSGNKYTGTLIEGANKLKPLVILNQTYYLDKGKLEKKLLEDKILDTSEIIYNGVYESKKYTLLYKLMITLDIKNNRHINQIKDIFRMNDFETKFDSCIDSFNKYTKNETLETDKITGIKIPTEKCRYSFIVLEEPIDCNKNEYKVVDEETEKFYINALNIMNTKVRNIVKIKEMKLALFRKVTSKGITYNVASAEGYSSFKFTNVRLEDIYKDRDSYGNIKEVGNTITIRGLDGVYEYNMDKIHEVYQRYEINSVKNLKARMLNIGYKESITALGELKELVSDDSTITIPTRASIVLKESIVIYKTTTKIIIGKNVTKFDTNAFRFITEYARGTQTITSITIGCDKKAAMGVLKAIVNADSLLDYSAEIVFDRDIDAEEYAFILFNKLAKKGNVKSNNLINMTDKFIEDTMVVLINNHLKGFKVLNRPKEVKGKFTKISKKLSGFKEDIQYNVFELELRKLISIWNHVLSDKASEKLRISIDSTLDKAQNLLEFRKKEYEAEKLKFSALFGLK